MSTTKLILASLLVVSVLVAGIVLVSSQIAAAASTTGNLSSYDQEQIEAVIQSWYEFHYEASINGGDVSKFPTVLIDTDDYPLDSEQQKMVQEVWAKPKRPVIFP